MPLTMRLAARAEAALCEIGLLSTPEWEDVLGQRVVKLYAGDLPRSYEQHADFYGITPFRKASRNIAHDLVQPLPIPDNSVDLFQAEDVFEHISHDTVPGIIEEIHRVLKPGGLFRFSVPDYNCTLYTNRSLRDESGKIVFDPGGGGRYENGRVVGGGHVWFPTISSIRPMFEDSPFEAVDYLQYYEEGGQPVNRPVDHRLAPVRRSAEMDERQGIHPVSIIVDAWKEKPKQNDVSRPEINEGPASRRGTGLADFYDAQQETTRLTTVLKAKLLAAIKGITPPYLAQMLRSLKNRGRDSQVFWGDAALFEEHLQGATAYGEYGCGLSTLWVAERTELPILSVDTSHFWISKVKNDASRSTGLDILHVDLGPLGDWGRPLSYERRHAIKGYTEGIWNRQSKPDLVLVDGRFRVACFLASLLRADPGSVILFDDYTDRDHYHVVEEFLRPFAHCGRQAAFRVPPDLPRQTIDEEYEKFLYVMD